MSKPDVQRLGKYVKARRKQLGMSQNHVAANGGPSDRTQTVIEHGEGGVPGITVLKRYDVALKWVPGSAYAVLHGEEPTEDTPELLAERLAERRLFEQHVPTHTRAEVTKRIRNLSHALEELGGKKLSTRRITTEGAVLGPDDIDGIAAVLKSLPRPEGNRND